MKKAEVSMFVCQLKENGFNDEQINLIYKSLQLKIENSILEERAQITDYLTRFKKTISQTFINS